MIINYKQEVDSNSYDLMPTLSWEQYQNHCHQPAWEETSSKAKVQVECAHLEGLSVSWEGYVTNVRLKTVRNNVALVINKLPDILKVPLSCLIGKQYKDNECKAENGIRKSDCQVFLEIQKKKQKCHLADWNWYEFEISVKMKSGMWGSNTEVTLIGDQSFKNFSLNIYPGDKIWFSGTLLNSGLERESLLGGSKPHINLEKAGCLACHTIDLRSFERYRYQVNYNLILRSVFLGIKTVLNSLFNPIVIFK